MEDSLVFLSFQRRAVETFVAIGVWSRAAEKQKSLGARVSINRQLLRSYQPGKRPELLQRFRLGGCLFVQSGANKERDVVPVCAKRGKYNRPPWTGALSPPENPVRGCLFIE